MSAPPAFDLPVGADNGSSEIVWRPTPEYIERSRLRGFMERGGVESFAALVERAAADPAWFWDAVVRDLDLSWIEPYSQTLDLAAGVIEKRWTYFLPDGRRVERGSAVRLYMPHDLATMFRRAGFERVAFYGAVARRPLDLASPRCICVRRGPA